MPRFQWVGGDVNFVRHGGVWVSEALRCQGIEYRMVLRLTVRPGLGMSPGQERLQAASEPEMDDAPRYGLALSVVSPDLAREQGLDDLLAAWGLDRADFDWLGGDPVLEAVWFEERGLAGLLWVHALDDVLALLEEGRVQAAIAHARLHVYLEEGMLGDLLSGHDLPAPQ